MEAIRRLYRDSKFDPIVWRMHQVLLRPEVTLGRLDRRVAEQELDLLQLAARGPA